MFPETPSYSGPDLNIGFEVRGPAVVREPTTTIVVYPEHTLQVTDKGNYLLTIGSSPSDSTKDAR